MPFELRFFYSQIPEWKEMYIDYAKLAKQVKQVKKDAIKKAKKKATRAESAEVEIEVGKLNSTKEFYRLLEEDLNKVEAFYLAQLHQFNERFHVLVLQAVNTGMLEEYVPLTKGQATALQQQLDLIGLKSQVDLITSQGSDAGLHEAGVKLLKVTPDKDLTELLEQLRSSETEPGSPPSKKQVDLDVKSRTSGSEDSSLDFEAQPMGVDPHTAEKLTATAKLRRRNVMVAADTELRANQELLSSGEKQTAATSANPSPPRSPGEHFHQLKDFILNHLPNEKDKAADQLKAAFAEFYRGLSLLHNFAQLNIEAVEKLLKLVNTTIDPTAKHKYMKHHLLEFQFRHRFGVKTLIRESEYVYAKCFTNDNRRQATQDLRVPPVGHQQVGLALFRFGFFLGCSITMLAATIYYVCVLEPKLVDTFRPGLIIYRMLAMVVLMMWLWGLDMWAWTKYRVNYVFIFEFNPRSHTRYHYIFEGAAVFSFIVSLSALLYVLTAAQHGEFATSIAGFTWLTAIPPHTVPLFLLGVILAVFVYYQIKYNWWLMRTFGRIFAAPFIPVVFRDFFLADQLMSLVIVLQDFEYTICYYTTDAWNGTTTCQFNHTWVLNVIAAIPAFYRLFQCFRRFYDTRDRGQLLNLGKYATGLVVVVLATFRKFYPGTPTTALWIISVIASTIYTYLWDILRDWSLGDIHNKSHCLLRTNLLFPVWLYYLAMVLNLGLRFLWTLTISPDQVRGALNSDVFSTILASVEVFRRALWNLFRLENEQLTNCGKFRVIQDMPLPVISKSNTATV